MARFRESDWGRGQDTEGIGRGICAMGTLLEIGMTGSKPAPLSRPSDVRALQTSAYTSRAKPFVCHRRALSHSPLNECANAVFSQCV